MKHTYIICEIGVNHNGDIQLAKRMIDESYRCGCDAVKFQAFKTSKLVAKDTSLAEYQRENTSKKVKKQYDMLKQYELSESSFIELKKYTDSLKLDFIVTPFDFESLDFLKQKLKLKLIKFSSADLNNYPLIQKAIDYGMSMILSTGMSTLKGIQDTVQFIEKSHGTIEAILHCTTSYPTNYDEVNLNVIDTLKDNFNYKIGYSDHTIGELVPLSAVAKGAQVIEKHVTTSCDLEGPDHKASMEFTDLKKMIDKIRLLEVALGNPEKVITESENKNKNIVIKKIVASHDLNKGTLLKLDDLDYLRSEIGIEVKHVYEILNKEIILDISKNSPITWEMLKNE